MSDNHNSDRQSETGNHPGTQSRHRATTDRQRRHKLAQASAALRKSASAVTRSRVKHPEKAQLREELEQATRQFLSSGGQVKEVPAGTSAWEPGTRPPPSNPIFSEPRPERTPVGDVVATIEARREAMKKRKKPVRQTRRSRARRQVLYDDFGEPLRRIWVED